jgi:hypothetical protein
MGEEGTTFGSIARRLEAPDRGRTKSSAGAEPRAKKS